MSESSNTLVGTATLHPDSSQTTLTPDERWAQWKAEGARQDARSRRVMRLIAFFAVLALAIAFIWTAGPSR
jgi:hypothetical protein